MASASRTTSPGSPSAATPPRLRICPEYTHTLGPFAAAHGATFGLTPDPWQAEILADWLALHPDGSGRWASSSCGLCVPRQNGKNGVLELREVFGLVYRAERILHTAHRGSTIDAHFRRLLHFFGSYPGDPNAKYPELNRLLKSVRTGKGDQRIELTNGGIIHLGPRSRQIARGESIDLLVLDEAQDTDPDALAALLAIVSASPNPQTIFAGTPPSPTSRGASFTKVRAAASDDGAIGWCWHEWGVVGDLADIDVLDEALWAATNPAWPHRIRRDQTAVEASTLPKAHFARERLGWWGVEPGQAEDLLLVDPELWAAQVGEHPADGTVPTALAVDMSHDRLLAVAACILHPDGRSHVELVAADYTSDPGDLVEWLARKARRRIPVVLDGAGPAASLAAPLKARRVRVTETGANAAARAAGLFVDELTAGRLTHAGQPALDQAIAGAYRRPIRGTSGFGVGRLDPDADIAPAVAAVLARYGADHAPRTTGRGRRDSPNRKGRAL